MEGSAENAVRQYAAARGIPENEAMWRLILSGALRLAAIGKYAHDHAKTPAKKAPKRENKAALAAIQRKLTPKKKRGPKPKKAQATENQGQAS